MFFNDIEYNSNDFAKMFDTFFTNGVLKQVGDQLRVTTNVGMSVAINNGSAFINGRIYTNDDVVILPIKPSDTATSRVDRVVLRFNLEERRITPMIVEGVFASFPTGTDIIRNDNIYDLCLAEVRVNEKATAIFLEDITSTISNKDLCGYVAVAIAEEGDIPKINIIDSFLSDSEVDPISANKGKEIYDALINLEKEVMDDIADMTDVINNQPTKTYPNLMSNKWVLTNTLDPRLALFSIEYKDKLYMFGGNIITSDYVKEYGVYDIYANTYTKLGDLPSAPVALSGGMISDTKCILVSSKFTVFYDFETNTLETKKTVPNPSPYMAEGTVSRDYFYYFSAYSSKQTEAENRRYFKYDYAKDTWSEHSLSDTPPFVTTVFFVSYNNEIYASASRNSLHHLAKFNFATESFTIINTTKAFFGTSSRIIEGSKLHMLGGGYGSSVQDEYYKHRVYDFETNTVTYEPGLLFKYIRGGALGIANGHFYMVGGSVFEDVSYGVFESYYIGQVYLRTPSFIK